MVMEESPHASERDRVVTDSATSSHAEASQAKALTASHGKRLVALMLILAFACATYAWWHQWQRGDGALQFWGTDAARLIRTARHIELWLWDPALQLQPQQAVSDLGQQATRRCDASRLPGITHLRQALISDRSFESFDADEQAAGVTISSAWYFQDGEDEVLVGCDLEQGSVINVPGQQRASLTPQMMNGLRRYVNDVKPENR
jgi:hypothetical protein